MREVIGRRFERLEEIGRGADSVVYRAVDRQSGDEVAVKVFTADPSFSFADLSRELQARKACDSPCIVPIFAYGTEEIDDEPRYYVVTPLLQGESLEARLERGTLSEADAVSLVGKLAAALHPIHESGLVHSDLKPANIFFTEKGDLKLLDFGLARGLTHVGAIGGTASYAAPEQLLGQPCDCRTDLYSLGCVFYELVTGRPPFVADDVADVLFSHVNTPPPSAKETRPELSPFVDGIISALLAKSPEERFSSALELQQTLEAGEKSVWWSTRLGEQEQSTTKPIGGWELSRPWQVPLVGREVELRRLQDFISAAVKRSCGCFVVVRGPAGVGKTRLVEEALMRLGNNALILTARCIGFETRVPYLPLIDLIDNIRRRDKYDAARFQRFVTRHLPQTPLLVPRFMEFLTKQAGSESGPDTLTTDNLLYLFTSLFHHLAEGLPLVLFIDDLHYAEPSTCNFLKYFVRNIVDVPLVVVGGYRPEELAAKGEAEPPLGALLRDVAIEPNFESIELRPLSAKESQELVAGTCGRSVADELGVALYRETEGNPLFLLESIALLQEDGVIVGEGEESRVAGSVSQISIPSTVADLLSSRLARLSDEDRELLELASIQGPSFRSDLLAQGDEDRLSMLRRLNRLEREHGVIRSQEGGYSFDHHLLYEYLYRSIAPDLREAYHRSLAERIASSVTEPGEETIYALADHYSRGGDNRNASEFLLKAARLSMAKYSGAEALDALERAREHFEGLPSSESTQEWEWEYSMTLAEVSAHLGDHAREEKAVGDLERLAESFGTREKKRDATERHAGYAVRVSKFDDALERFSEARRIAEELGDAHRVAELVHRIGTTYREMGRRDEAMQSLREAFDLAESVGDKHLIGCILKDIATVKTQLERYEEAAKDYRSALPLLLEAGDRREEAWALNGLAVSLFCAGDRDAALECWEEAGEVFESIGYPSGRSIILHNLGVTHTNLGEMDRALECLQKALLLRKSIGMRHAVVTTQTWLGFVYSILGAYDRAAEQLRSALSIVREIARDPVGIVIYYYFTDLAIAQGDLDAAAGHLKRAWDALGERADPVHRAHLEYASGRLALARKEWEAAAKHLDRALATEGVEDSDIYAEILAHRAWTAQTLGDTKQAQDLLKRHSELSRARPFIYARMLGNWVAERVYGLMGDKENRRAARNRLREDLKRIDEGLSDKSLRESFIARWGEFLEEAS